MGVLRVPIAKGTESYRFRRCIIPENVRGIYKQIRKKKHKIKNLCLKEKNDRRK